MVACPVALPISIKNKLKIIWEGRSWVVHVKAYTTLSYKLCEFAFISIYYKKYFINTTTNIEQASKPAHYHQHQSSIYHNTLPLPTPEQHLPQRTTTTNTRATSTTTHNHYQHQTNGNITLSQHSMLVHCMIKARPCTSQWRYVYIYIYIYDIL